MNHKARHRDINSPDASVLQRALTRIQYAALRQCCKRERLTHRAFWISIPIATIATVLMLSGVFMLLQEVLYRFEVPPLLRGLMFMLGCVTASLPSLIGAVNEAECQRQMAFSRMRNLHGRPYFCHKCSYDLRRSRTPTCPECGWEIRMENKQPRERWRVIRGRVIAGNIMLAGMIVASMAVIGALWMFLTGRLT